MYAEKNNNNNKRVHGTIAYTGPKSKNDVYLDPEVCTLEIVALAMFELDPTQYSSLSTTNGQRRR